MPKMVNNAPFTGKETGGTLRQFTIDAGTGSVTLESLGSGDVDTGTWVAVPDGAYSADTSATFYCAPGLWYRWVITGNAAGNMSS